MSLPLLASSSSSMYYSWLSRLACSSSSRCLSSSSSRGHRQLVIQETEKEKHVSAVSVSEEKREKLLDVSKLNAKPNCHPLCRLPFVHEIKHTDVLILEQFVDDRGRIIDRDVLGLCRRQHVRMSKLIKMAQKAGLMSAELDVYADEKEDDLNTPWAKYNSYWDEKSVDAQWINREWMDYRSQFP